MLCLLIPSVWNVAAHTYCTYFEHLFCTYICTYFLHVTTHVDFLTPPWLAKPCSPSPLTLAFKALWSNVSSLPSPLTLAFKALLALSSALRAASLAFSSSCCSATSLVLRTCVRKCECSFECMFQFSVLSDRWEVTAVVSSLYPAVVSSLSLYPAVVSSISLYPAIVSSLSLYPAVVSSLYPLSRCGIEPLSFILLWYRAFILYPAVVSSL